MDITKQIIVFSIGGQNYGIKIEKVYQIVTSSLTEQISQQMICVAGETICLCSLNSLFGIESNPDNNLFCVVFSSEGKKVFSVNRIEGLFNISVDNIKSYNPVLGYRNKLIREFALLDNNIVPLLDTDNL